MSRHEEAIRSEFGPSFVEKFHQATKAYQEFMDALGIPKDQHSQETAERVAKMFFLERCLALHKDPPAIKLFDNEGCNEYVVVRDIPYVSICAHHHVAFFGKVHVAYLPGKKVTGLSKFGRVVQYFASKPQIQEELTTEISKFLWDSLEPKGLAVRIEGEHLCMTQRGVKAHGSKTITNFVKNMDKREVEGLFDGHSR